MQTCEENPDPDCHINRDEVHPRHRKMPHYIPHRHHDNHYYIAAPTLKSEQADFVFAGCLLVDADDILAHYAQESEAINENSDKQSRHKRQDPIAGGGDQPIRSHRAQDDSDRRPDGTGQNQQDISTNRRRIHIISYN